MFDSLNDRLSGLFDRLSGRGVLSEKDVDEALREVRVALLEADVALPVVRTFMAKARELATGEAIIKAVKPADQVVKIVYDGLIDMLGGEEPTPINLNAVPPVVILMAGLQGSGKTTTSAKLALRLTKFDRKKVMMASLDTRRPAAMEQLKLLGEQIEVPTLPIMAGQNAVEITKRALSSARLQGFDVLILDTAGRTTLDEEMMNEAAEIARLSSPTETFLVADSLTGQDAVRTAEAFHARLPLTGLILTRADDRARLVISTAPWPAMIGRVGTSICSPSSFSCSMAAGRRVSSEAIMTFLRSNFVRRKASLAEVVVLPEPCRPAIRTTIGGTALRLIGVGSSPPSMSIRPS